MNASRTGTAVGQPPPTSPPAKREERDGAGFGLLLIILFIVGAYALKFQVQSELGIGWSKDVGDGVRLYQGPEGEARTAGLLWIVFRALLWLAATMVVLWALAMAKS